MSSSVFVNIPVLGTVKITASDVGVRGIAFVKGSGRSTDSAGLQHTSGPIFHRAVRELRLYAKGILKRFSVPVDTTSVTGFTRLVLEEVRRVPYGKTVSYKQLASAMGRVKAARAVGNSLGKNPVPVIVPCHRVIKADGTCGGFSSGTEIKKKLLGIERVRIKDRAGQLKYGHVQPG
ncbi:MAG: methylated-DNA--[protein]-cysteine S-methyltransferase [Deltaproteobacteria bacterium]|nr:methylated-DNA--[protein]-cysteine S-methyltransferase [Deltaproteobacteria bacterium]MCL5276972.1 methylated-DNA--[protein]-cysteine S-methyltransferase [Deltaproteobacteria bacterium]